MASFEDARFRTLMAIIATVIVVALSLITVGFAGEGPLAFRFEAVSEPAGDRIALLQMTEEPYPAPVPTVTATFSPLPNGQLPVPAGVATETVTIGSSPYSFLLQPLDSALQAQNSVALGAMLSPVTDDFGTFPYFAIGVHGREAFVRVEDSVALFEELFEAGAQPRMQGYFDSEFGGMEDDCIELFVSGWASLSSSAVLLSTPPRNEATELPPLGPTPVRRTGSDEFENGVDTIKEGVYIWYVCGDGGPPEIFKWGVRDYGPAVEERFVLAQTIVMGDGWPDRAKYFVIVE